MELEIYPHSSKEGILIEDECCLRPFSQLMVETEQMARNITDNLYLVDDFTCMFFFFYLLLDEPLEHLK